MSFLKLSGVSLEVIGKCESAERRKYELLGTFVLLTSFMAWATATYAAYTTCDNLFISVLFGLFWSFLIFTLDRFIISTAPLEKVEDTFKLNRLAIFLRFLMGIAIGFIMAAPFEVYAFEDKILKYIDQKMQTESLNYPTQLHESSELDKIKIYNNEQLEEQAKRIVDIGSNVSVLEEQLKNKEHEKSSRLSELDLLIENAKEEKVCEITEGCANHNPGKTAGMGHYYYKFEKQENINKRLKDKEEKLYNDAIAKIRYDLSKTISNNQSRLITEKEKIEAKNKENEEKASKLKDVIEDKRKVFMEKYPKDFSARLSALWELNKLEPSLRTISLSITILILFVETLPVTIKAIGGYGSYELLCYDEKIRQEKSTKDLEKYCNSTNKVQDDAWDRTNLAIWANLEKVLIEKANLTIDNWKTIFKSDQYVEDLNNKFEILWAFQSKNVKNTAIKNQINSSKNVIQRFQHQRVT